tara:strand:- start:1722 stop:2405 length:684 start_codon:yes stop_codon:yes gene_type:complete
MRYKTIDIELPKTGNILLWVSGGLDSAAGLYLIARHIKENKLKNRIVVATWQRDSDDNPGEKKQIAKDWNVKHAEKVIAKVKTLLKIPKNSKLISDHIIIPTPPKTGLRIDESEWQKVYYRHEKRMKLKDTFGFVTKNPTRSIMQENDMWEDRPAYRDGVKRQHNSKPFQNYDKRFIAKIFEDEGLMKTLYPVTRSCEGQADKTQNFTKPCKKCWWCKEKKWAFTKY